MKKPITLSILCIAIVVTTTACMHEYGNDDVLGVSNNLYNKHEDWGVLYPFEEDGLWGFKDIYDKVIVEPQYLYVHRFSEGLAFVRGTETKEHQTGFIDLAGNLVIPLPSIFSVGSFSEGFAFIHEWDETLDLRRDPGAPVKIGSMGHVIFIDRTGQDVFDQKFHSALSFSEGLAFVRYLEGDEHKAGFIDTTGELIISTPNIVQGGSFHEGFAHIIARMWANDETRMSVSLPGPFIFIDRTGKNI